WAISSMASLPQCLPPPATGTRSIDETALAQAFGSFTEAASSLERSYNHLQAEVVRLRREREETNRDLAQSLEENLRIRRHRNRILEGLPCGVMVRESDGGISVLNPEARRLLAFPTAPESWDQMPIWIRTLLDATEAGTAERTYNCRLPHLEW